MPANARQQIEAQFLRIPRSAAEARRQVDELKNVGVDGIKAVLESGGGETLFNRLDTALLQAIAQEAHTQGLPLVVHTGDVRDVSGCTGGGRRIHRARVIPRADTRCSVRPNGPARYLLRSHLERGRGDE